MRIPLFPLDIVLFPNTFLKLHIFEQPYKDLIGECVHRQTPFGIVRARQNGLAIVGCLASVVAVEHRYPDDSMDIICCGERRFEIESLYDDHSFLEAEVDFLVDREPTSTRQERELCAALHMQVVQLSDGSNKTPHLDLNRPVAYRLACSIPADMEFKQELLHLHSDAQRTLRLTEFYRSILPKLQRGVLNAKTSVRRVM